MAQPLKNIYHRAFFDEFIRELHNVFPDFDERLFINAIYDDGWDNKELKERMRHIATILKDSLPADYPKAIDIILKLTKNLQKDHTELSFAYMFLPDYIEQYGLDDYETSMKALEIVTQFTSCEFAVRPFIKKYPDKMMMQMLAWSQHTHYAVRRFASEGCRPRLPWAMALPALKKDPTPIGPILENLKDDPSLFVRRSVANNLNDIAKDNPTTVIHFAKKWHGQSDDIDWVIKHGCRTLLKQGNQELMQLFGFGSTKDIKINNFSILTPLVKIGEVLEFSFQIKVSGSQDIKIRLEYAVYYQKANGTLSKKVYKISEKKYTAHSTTSIHRKQSFRLITTRKFHPGLHHIAIIINGKEYQKYPFELFE